MSKVLSLSLSQINTVFLHICSRSTNLLKTQWAKEKLLSFSHRVTYPFGEFSAIFIEFKIVVCKLWHWKSKKIVVWERVLYN